MAVASTRPELACEIVPEGVIAARRQPGSGLLASASFAAFGPNGPTAAFAPYLDKDAPKVGMPGLQAGNPQQRDAVVQAMRRALESVGGKNGVLTLVIPDTAVRVLIMDFDSLPSKAADAIPLLRFRLKKMVAFDVDDAQISYQPLHAATTGARALVAVLPNAVLREYEAVVREAGFEPGIVLPSTLACLGMLEGGDTALVVHSSTQCVTTAIAGAQELMLHRTQELPWSPAELVETMNPSSNEPTSQNQELEHAMELSTYTEESSATEFNTSSVTNVELARRIEEVRYPETLAAHILKVNDDLGAVLPAEPTSQTREVGHPALYPMIERGDPTDNEGEELQTAWGNPWQSEAAVPVEEPVAPVPVETEIAPEQAATLQVDSATSVPGSVQAELHDAVIVAAAYFEDAVGRTPSPILVAGAMDARAWQTILGEGTVTVRDLVALEDMGTAIDSGLSRAQLGAVCGALRG
jgi:type IV pilus assembly protein PilM